jgi:hypothetical protein
LPRFCELLLQTAAATCLALNRMMSMAIAHPAHCAGDCRELVKSRLRLNGLLSLPSRPLTVAVVVLALGIGGCARNPADRELNPVQREIKATHVRSPARARPHAETPQHVELRVRRPDPALLAAQPPPNCELKRADFKTVDPDEWARLKTEYERQCYQDAEKAARDRLSQLQASGSCEIERVPQQRSIR